MGFVRFCETSGAVPLAHKGRPGRSICLWQERPASRDQTRSGKTFLFGPECWRAREAGPGRPPGGVGAALGGWDNGRGAPAGGRRCAGGPARWPRVLGLSGRGKLGLAHGSMPGSISYHACAYPPSHPHPMSRQAPACAMLLVLVARSPAPAPAWVFAHACGGSRVVHGATNIPVVGGEVGGCCWGEHARSPCDWRCRVDVSRWRHIWHELW
jgi:hypothetical protein